MPFSEYLRENLSHSWDPAHTDDPHDDEVSRIYEVSKMRGNVHDPCMEISDDDEVEERNVGVGKHSWNTCLKASYSCREEDEVNKGGDSNHYHPREWVESIKDEDCEYSHDDD